MEGALRSRGGERGNRSAEGTTERNCTGGGPRCPELPRVTHLLVRVGLGAGSGFRGQTQEEDRGWPREDGLKGLGCGN